MVQSNLSSLTGFMSSNCSIYSNLTKSSILIIHHNLFENKNNAKLDLIDEIFPTPNVFWTWQSIQQAANEFVCWLNAVMPKCFNRFNLCCRLARLDFIIAEEMVVCNGGYRRFWIPRSKYSASIIIIYTNAMQQRAESRHELFFGLIHLVLVQLDGLLRVGNLYHMERLN